MNERAIFQKSIERNCSELAWAKACRISVKKVSIAGYPLYGTQFLGIAFACIRDALLSHLIKILDNGQRTASFWYILKTETERVNEIVKKHNLKLDTIHSVSSKLRLIRNKTLFHLDRKALFNTEELWESLDLRNSEIDSAISSLDIILRSLYKAEFKKPPPFANYEGKDIDSLLQIAKKNDLV